jgi:hypothetical protein
VKITIRKITSLLFLLLGILPLLFILSFHIQQHLVREHMKEELERRNLQTLQIPEQDVIWMDKHEIWVNEQMFDIHSRSLEKGIYTFTGLYDAQETLLVKQHEDATGKNLQENKVLAQLFKCLQTIFFESLADAALQTTSPAISFASLTMGPIKQFRVILTPPPQPGAMCFFSNQYVL